MESFDAALLLALRRIVVGDGEGFGPLQVELAALKKEACIVHGGEGVLWSRYSALRVPSDRFADSGASRGDSV